MFFCKNGYNFSTLLLRIWDTKFSTKKSQNLQKQISKNFEISEQSFTLQEIHFQNFDVFLQAHCKRKHIVFEFSGVSNIKQGQQKKTKKIKSRPFNFFKMLFSGNVQNNCPFFLHGFMVFKHLTPFQNHTKSNCSL